MKRKARWLLILIILAAFGIWLEPTRVPWGWLRGEAFYDGRPTSWWESELTHWEAQSCGSTIYSDMYNTTPHFHNIGYFRCSSLCEDLVAKALRQKTPAGTVSVLTHADPKSEAVLRELGSSSSRKVRWLAASGMAWLEYRRAKDSF